MTLPALGCRIAFGSNPFDDPQVFTEVGTANGGPGDVRRVKTKRGRERLLKASAQFQPGTATFGLRNIGRNYDPTNTAGSHYPNVQPEKVIQLYAIYNSVTYILWTGYIDDFQQSWPAFAEAETTIPATDLFKSLAIKRLVSTGYVDSLVTANASYGLPKTYLRLGDLPGAARADDAVGNNFGVVTSVQPTDTVTFGGVGAMPTSQGTCATFQGQGNIALSQTVLGSSAVTGFSFECWYKSTDTIEQQTLLRLNTSDNAHQIVVVVGGPLDTNPNKVVVFAPSGAIILFHPTTVNDGGWHHIRVTLPDGSFGNPASILVDGVAQHSAGNVSCPTISPNSGGGSLLGGIAGVTGTFSMQECALYGGSFVINTVDNDGNGKYHYSLGTWAAGHTGDRVNQILATVNHPSGQRIVDTGRTAVAADTANETTTKALALLQKCEQTEQGQCYVAVDGKLVFQDRYHRYVSPNANSQATFGDGGAAFPSEIPYGMGGVVLNFDRGELYNEIPVTRRGGTLQIAADTASQVAYTQRSMPGLSDLLMAADADAAYCGQWILADSKTPQYRVGDLVLDPKVDPRLWPLVLGLDIGAVITVNKHNIPDSANMLTPNQASVETDVSGWIANANCTVARSAAQALDGVGSLAMTSLAAGDMNAGHAAAGVLDYKPVIPGRNYTAMAWLRAATVGRTTHLYVNWYNASKTYLGTLTLTGTDVTTGWTQIVANNMNFPAGAAFAVIFPAATAGAAGEVHYADQMSLALGDGTAWPRAPGPPISLVCRIEGIEHQIDPPALWKTTWHVSLAGTAPWMILDDAVMSLLDHGNRLGW